MKFDEHFQMLLNEAEHHPFGSARSHLRHENLVAYIRIGRRVLGPDNVVSCVQIASVNIQNEKKQRRGLFTSMLNCILAMTNKPIFVESILNKEFGDALLRRGFVLLNDYDGASRDMVLYRDDINNACDSTN